MRPAKNHIYLKRVVKEKWDEIHRLRKRRVRWTIGGDRIEVGYDVGTNTAALPTVNALFHSMTPPVSHTELTFLSTSHPHLSSITTLFTPVSPVEKTWIQQVVGSLLFYARALDLFLLTAVCQLSSHKSTPTQHDLTSAHRLFNYASSHPNPHKTIHPSSMALWACTDASFLSRPKSRSVAGCSVGLETPTLPS
jgi:hypothetical protein